MVPRFRLVVVALVAVAVGGLPHLAHAGSAWEERSPAQRAGYHTAAAALNIIPVASAVGDSRCLAGFVLCKSLFAGFSVLAASTHLIFSGGGDLEQSKNLLRRGFGGDWYLTGRHLSGDRVADVYPQVSAPRSGPTKGFEPPPL